MKLLICLLLFMFVHEVNAQNNIVEYPLPKKHKVLGTNSVRLNDTTSLHIAIAKHKRTKKLAYKYFVVIHGEVTDIDPLMFHEDSAILSTHLSGDLLTVLYKYDKNSDIYGIDINIQEKSAGDPKKLMPNDYKTIIPAAEAVYFFGKKDSVFSITEVKNTNSIAVKQYHMSGQLSDALLKQMEEAKNVYINTDEPVAIGSTSSDQLFKFGDVFYATYDDGKKDETYVYALPFTDKTAYTVSPKKFPSPLGKSAVYKSFLTPKHLFSFSVERERKMSIDIFDLDTEAHVKALHYTHALFVHYHECYFKGKLKFPTAERFIKSFTAKRMKYAPAPFLTVNKTVSGGYLVEAGHVNGIVYRYNPFDDWWMQQWQMDNMQRWQMETQQHIQQLNNFKGGPNPETYDIWPFFEDPEPADKTAVKVSLDNAFNKTRNMETVQRDDEQTDRYDKSIETVKGLVSTAQLSYTGIGEVVRYMFFGSSSKTFYIRERKTIYDD